MSLPLPGVDHAACDLNRWAVAHHEAGHALLTTLAGYRLRYVTVRARGAEGRTVYPRRSVTREQNAREAAAGPIAEAELLAGLDPVTPVGRAPNDLQLRTLRALLTAGAARAMPEA